MDRKILVPVDGSVASARTIEAVIARRAQFQVPLTLLHVVNIDKLAYRMISEAQMEIIREHAAKAGTELLAHKQDLFASAGIPSVPRLEFGSPRESICQIANNEGFDLVILGRRGMGEIRDALFGAVSNHVLHHVRCPVLLI
jgi:nucleotide-binding universal stress UspA family protein